MSGFIVMLLSIKCQGGNVKAPTIKNAISIDERPLIVNSRERFGDWEIDTVLDKNGSGAIVIIFDRIWR